MDVDALRAGLRTFVAENFLFQDAASLDDSASLLESGLIDSTGAMELISHVEDLVGTTFADDQLVAANFDSIDRVVEFVTRTSA